MGILAPLFMAALAGLTLPIVFHLVRRTPRGRQEFSSLMFLAPTPPRLTRRSRLDQVLLLLMRLAALALLAFAFARPFLRESSLLSLSDLPRRRVAILLDTSASMRRGDLWQQALTQIGKELDDLAPHDDVALFTFSDQWKTIVGFDTDSKVKGAVPVEVVRQSLKDLKPSWTISDLGTAIAGLASELDAASDVQQSLVEPQLVAIGDFQHGSRLNALHGFAWPERVRVATRPLALKQTTNATLQLLANDEAAPDEEPRVRVVNAANSQHDQFHIAWQDPQRPTSSVSETVVYVPPGQSRVIKLPRPANLLFADRIVLRGDDHEFDNTYYVVPPRQQTIRLAYFGADAANDPQGCQYYLRLATAGDPLRQVELDVAAEDETDLLTKPAPPQLAVATKALSTEQLAQLTKYVEHGGTLVLVAADRNAAGNLPSLLTGVELEPAPPEKAPTEESARESEPFNLLGEIDFTHPLFAPLSNPRYNDFTRIHFWGHRAVKLKTAKSTRVVVRFDNGDPWLLERSLGKGRIWAVTSGWQPDDSQLAVSSKFVPLIGNLLDQACGAVQTSAGSVVNAPVALPRQRPAKLVVYAPDNQEFELTDDATEFAEASLPGVYRVGAGQDEFRFAVNLAPVESDTAPLALEELEQLGVRLSKDVSQAQRLEKMRQERDAELESRQQFWRWLLVGCLGVLIVETWWAGRASRAADKDTETVA